MSQSREGPLQVLARKFGQEVVNRYLRAVQQLDTENSNVAFTELQSLASINFDPAIHSVAHCIEHGIGGCEPDPRNAFNYYKTAALLGNCSSLNELGVYLTQGRWVEQNLEEALWCFQQSGKLGCLPGAYNFGCMLYFGHGTPVNIARALEVFKYAAANGHGSAANAAGICVANLDPSETGLRSAKVWFEKAEQLGCTPGAFNAQHVKSYLEKIRMKESLREIKQIATFLKILLSPPSMF